MTNYHAANSIAMWSSNSEGDLFMRNQLSIKASIKCECGHVDNAEYIADKAELYEIDHVAEIGTTLIDNVRRLRELHLAAVTP